MLRHPVRRNQGKSGFEEPHSIIVGFLRPKYAMAWPRAQSTIGKYAAIADSCLQNASKDRYSFSGEAAAATASTTAAAAEALREEQHRKRSESGCKDALPLRSANINQMRKKSKGEPSHRK